MENLLQSYEFFSKKLCQFKNKSYLCTAIENERYSNGFLTASLCKFRT